jgi:cytochrome c oxidase subunit 3
MSDLVSQQQAAVALAGDTSAPARDHHHHPHGNPNLAHHFDTPEQQYGSAKIGMWVFLATELLMFGGLFCAYSVYRHNHPEVFLYAHHYLDKTWGAINTVVLLASSLTMAWGVRSAQLGQRKTLIVCLILTLLGGGGFMVIKTIEYSHKYHEHVWFGSGNKYSKIYNGPVETGPASGTLGRSDTSALTQTEREHAARVHEQATTPTTTKPVGAPWVDPNAGTADEAKIKPAQIIPAGLAKPDAKEEKHQIRFEDLPQIEKDRVATFFNIYFMMTGLHGVHVLIGMGLITWVLIRAIKAEFGPRYYTPVDLVGLYWHLVDLIWIFLFPLLYLIH